MESRPLYIVTGASGGMGQVLTTELLRRGYRTVMACRDLKKSEPIRQRILQRCSVSELELLPLDLASLDSIRQFAERLKQRNETIGVLINNAGSMIINPGKFLASAIASLTQPLFNRGANIAGLKIAKAQQEEARIAFEMALLSAGSEVNDALTQYQTAKGKSEYYEKQVASLETAAKSTALLMKHGNTTYLEVLTAQQTLLNARLNNIANRFSEIQSIITLYRALGGGRI